MKTQVSILHHDYPRRIVTVVEDKLERLARFYGRVISMRANLERQKEEHRVELVANVGRGSILVADVKGTGFTGTLDEALDRMTTQLKKHHDKVRQNRHRASRSAE